VDDFSEKRRRFELEVNAKMADRGCRIYKVDINNSVRTYDEVKQIN